MWPAPLVRAENSVHRGGQLKFPSRGVPLLEKLRLIPPSRPPWGSPCVLIYGSTRVVTGTPTVLMIWTKNLADRIAGILRNRMDVIRVFIEHFARRQGHQLPPCNLHVYPTLQHIDKNMGIVTMGRR